MNALGINSGQLVITLKSLRRNLSNHNLMNGGRKIFYDVCF